MSLMRLLWLLALLVSSSIYAVEDVALEDIADEQRFNELANELRCMVCQNQSIADSNAELARDFRNQVKEKINAGESNEQIKDYMIARYGDYILYRPPFNMATALLWVGPFLLVIIGAFIVFRLIKRPARQDEVTVDARQQSRLKSMLDDEEGSS
jgi:cytochrome c-type biogenesis protein CcmH